MSVRNQNWYNLQATRRYPLDDTSTGEDNSGNNIRESILVDCHIRAPRRYGRYFYVQGINISNTLVTLLIGATEELDSTTTTTIGAVSVLKPLAEYVNVPLTAIQPGVTGWVAFGAGIRENFSGRYGTAAQTLISARCGRPYTDLPIQTIGKNNLATALTGLVQINAAAPVTAQYYDAYAVPKYNPKTGETNATPVKAIVFSGEAPTADFNPYSYFLGPCSQRPETGTCNKTPIETINGVTADCETGNINIVFGGGLSGRPFKDCGGLDITTPLGLAEACNDKPPGQEKRRDICCPDEDGDSEYCWPEETQTSATTLPVLSQTQNLPVRVLLTETAPELFYTRSGAFDLKITGYAAVDPAVANISTYNQSASDWVLNTDTRVVFRLIDDTPAIAGALLNFSVSVLNGRPYNTYTAAVVNKFDKKLQIVTYNARALIVEQEAELAAIPEMWAVTVRATPANDRTNLYAQAHDATSGARLAELNTTVAGYEVVNGKNGLIALRHGAVFKEFSVQ